MKKIIAFIPVWVLFYTGDLISKTFTKINSVILYRFYSWCMEKSGDMQDWAGLENPWHGPEPKSQNLEIERRWLITGLPKLKFDQLLIIRQYYTPTGRFRESYDGTSFKYYHTIKKTISSGVNEEIEIEITKSEFDESIKDATSYICKDRRKYKHDGLVYEFDSMLLSMDNITPCMYIMEVELDDINQEFVIPEVIKDVIIREITGEKQYSNFSLSVKL